MVFENGNNLPSHYPSCTMIVTAACILRVLKITLDFRAGKLAMTYFISYELILNYKLLPKF